MILQTLHRILSMHTHNWRDFLESLCHSQQGAVTPSSITYTTVTTVNYIYVCTVKITS